MARHAEESRDDLQAMKALNVFYQVRFMLCFCNVVFLSLDVVEASGIASFEVLWVKFTPHIQRVRDDAEGYYG